MFLICDYILLAVNNKFGFLLILKFVFAYNYLKESENK